MHQKRWLKLMADYAIDLQYHSDKVNIVLDALSRIPIAMRLMKQKELISDIENHSIEVFLLGSHEQLMNIQVRSSLIDHIKEQQLHDEELIEVRIRVPEGKRKDIWIDRDDSFRKSNHLCVLAGEVHKELLDEVYCLIFSIHPGGMKMYKDLKLHFRWDDMQHDIVEYVSECLTCQQVKA